METWHISFGGTNVPSPALGDAQPLCVQRGAQQQLIATRESTSKHPRPVPGGPGCQQGQAPRVPEGFSRPTSVETVLGIRVYLLKQKPFLMDLANVLYYFIV